MSQLISVDSEYSAAIETALGAALQNIVTDDENVAKRCINYLKSSREGRATFLPLTSVKQYEFRDRAVRDEDGIRGIASELVTCDGKYTGIVGSLLGRTAVAEDLDTAVRVARKYSYRFRVVTLDGQVVNAGGSMTGGSQVRGAGMLSRAGEIERLEKEALQLDSEAGELQKRLEEERAKYSEMKAQLNMKRSELTEANEDLIRQQGEQRLVAEQLENAKASLDELLREDATSAERLEKLKLEMSGGEAEISRLNQEQSLLRDELDSLTGERDGIEAEFEKTNSALSELRLEIMAADKDREAQAEAAAMLKESKAGHSERIKKIEAEIDGIREENRRLSCGGTLWRLSRKGSEMSRPPTGN